MSVHQLDYLAEKSGHAVHGLVPIEGLLNFPIWKISDLASNES